MKRKILYQTKNIPNSNTISKLSNNLDYSLGLSKLRLLEEF